MEININIAGEELNSKLAAKQLHLLADMVKAGVTDIDGASIGFLGTFSYVVDYESDGPEPHTDFMDGEGNHIHAADGYVVLRLRPGSEPEQLRDHNITVAEWAKDHGGITPFNPDDHEGHGH